MRKSMGTAIIAAALCGFIGWTVGGAGQELRLVAPAPSDTLQYSTDAFIVFFSPTLGEDGLEGLRFSITNTSGTSISIDWKSSYYVLPSGQRSDVITADIPSSFQRLSTQVAIRQTAEIVAIPLSNMSYSESGWSTAAIAFTRAQELTFHLVVTEAAERDPVGYDFVFQILEATDGAGGPSDPRWPIWTAVVALAVGFVLGLLFAVR